MAALPYMQLYVVDYLADTLHLTTEEHGAYLLLMFNYWQTSKPLRVNRLASIARLSNERWTYVERTLKEFFRETDGVWIHPRIEKDLEKVAIKSGKNSEAGKASALARSIVKQQLERFSADPQEQLDLTNVQRPFNERSTIEDKDKDKEKEQDQKLLSSLQPDGEGKEPKTKRPKKIDTTPYQAILEIYQRVCAGKFLGAEKLTDKRKIAIKRTYDLEARGKHPFHELEFWDRYFSRCVTNKHWMGENDRGWKADLEFVTRETNVLKVLGV